MVIRVGNDNDTYVEEQNSCLNKKDLEWQEKLSMVAEKKYEAMAMTITIAASQDGDST